MPNDAIRAAIEELHGKINEKERDILSLKKAVNVLCVTIGEPMEFTETEEEPTKRGLQIRPDQYFRKSITEAAQHFLKARGTAATVTEIIDALGKGGCDLGTSALRNVKISLSKNSGVFAEVNSEVFGLWDFYGGKPKTKKGVEAIEISADSDVGQPEVATESA